MKHNLSEINQLLGEAPETFICPVSYEERSLSIARAIEKSNLSKSLLLWNSDYLASVKENVSTLKGIFGNVSEEIELRTDNPLLTADNLRERVLPIIEKTTGLCLIDITSFTHEHLLILIRLMIEFAPKKKIKLVYSGADEYSTNYEGADKWLSKGLSTIRTVLGYPGIMLPSQKLHLIILVGFEAERAELLIFNSEPALLTLGLGRRKQSVTEELYETNVVFHKKVESFVRETLHVLESVQQFSFSCVDPIQTMNDIIEVVNKTPEYNTVICPLNTKPSTLGAALAATKCEKIQIIYTQPIEYNIEGYSHPSQSFTLYDFRELVAHLNLNNP